ncbi:MAG: phytanoyl-CoA dioxygenase family protein [Opitutaceae bacterium]
MTTPTTLPETKILEFRTNGFVHIPAIISKEEAARFARAALDLQENHIRNQTANSDRPVFTQMVNVWRENETMKALTLHPNVAAVATTLAGVPLRLWHDQILIKKPHNNAPTEFHQDQPYWPHANSPHPISAWIALVDVPVERGCMTFIPRAQSRTDLPAQNLGDSRSLFTICPDLEWEPRVILPLKAGDCTFHHGRCPHMATPNFTDDPRVAHVVIFIDRTTTYRKQGHVVTDPLGLEDGALLEGDLFPEVG